jgi:hypothetical protein
MEHDGGTVAGLVGRISQLELLLKQALEQHNASEKENVDLRALLHRCVLQYWIYNRKPLTKWRSLGSAVAEQATPQLYHSMVLQLKLRQVRRVVWCVWLQWQRRRLKWFQAEIAALQSQLKASQSGALDLAAVAAEEAAVRAKAAAAARVTAVF